MAAPSPLRLAFLLSALVFAVSHSESEFLKREHSLVRPYQGSGFGNPNWDFLGSTMVTSQHIRLTPDVQSQQGAIWNTVVSGIHRA